MTEIFEGKSTFAVGMQGYSEACEQVESLAERVAAMYDDPLQAARVDLDTAEMTSLQILDSVGTTEQHIANLIAVANSDHYPRASLFPLSIREEAARKAIEALGLGKDD